MYIFKRRKRSRRNEKTPYYTPITFTCPIRMSTVQYSTVPFTLGLGREENVKIVAEF